MSSFSRDGWTRFVSRATTTSRVEVDPERGPGEAEVTDRPPAAPPEPGAERRALVRRRVPPEGARRCRASRRGARTPRRPRRARSRAGPRSASSQACPNAATSGAVEKTPAWPATPPIAQALSSFTAPRFTSWRCSQASVGANARPAARAAASRGARPSRKEVVGEAERAEDSRLRERRRAAPRAPPPRGTRARGSPDRSTARAFRAAPRAARRAPRRARAPAPARTRGAGLRPAAGRRAGGTRPSPSDPPSRARSTRRQRGSPEAWASSCRGGDRALPARLEAGEARRDRRVERERPLADELRHDRRGRHHLRERGDVEEVSLARGRGRPAPAARRASSRGRAAPPRRTAAESAGATPARRPSSRTPWTAARTGITATPAPPTPSKRSRGGPSSPGAGATSVARAPSGRAKFASSWPAGSPSMAGTPSASTASRTTSAASDPAVVAGGEAADRDPREAVERAGEPELREAAVDPVRLLADVLEEQDRALEPRRERRAREVREDRERPAEERSGGAARPHRARPDEPGAGSRDAPGPGARRVRQEQRLEVAHRVLRRPAELGHDRPVHGREPGPVQDRVERRDVREADERLRAVEERRRVHRREDPHRAVPAPRAEDRAGLRVRDRLPPLLGAAGVVAGEVGAARREVGAHPRHEPEASREHLEPLLERGRIRTGSTAR